MDTARIYHDTDGNECTIWQMVKCEPEWAANRIQVGESAIAEVAILRAENERLRAAFDHIDDELIKELNAQIAIVQNSRKETWENRPITSPNHNARYINECDRRLRVARAAILSKSIRLMEDSVVALASMDL